MFLLPIKQYVNGLLALSAVFVCTLHLQAENTVLVETDFSDVEVGTDLSTLTPPVVAGWSGNKAAAKTPGTAVVIDVNSQGFCGHTQF